MHPVVSTVSHSVRQECEVSLSTRPIPSTQVDTRTSAVPRLRRKMKSTRNAKGPLLSRKNQYSTGLPRTARSLTVENDTTLNDEQWEPRRPRRLSAASGFVGSSPGRHQGLRLSTAATTAPKAGVGGADGIAHRVEQICAHRVEVDLVSLRRLKSSRVRAAL